MSSSYRRSFEKVDSHPVQGFIDREGRWWECRCPECGLCYSAATESLTSHKPGCPRREELASQSDSDDLLESGIPRTEGDQ